MFTLCIALVCLQLEKRGERRAEAEKQLAKAQEAGESLCSSHSIQQSFWIRTLWIQSLTRDLVISFSYFFPRNKTFPQLSCVCVITGEQENIDKFTKRLVKVTKQHNDECKKLLALMGVPFVEVQTCCPFCTCASQLEGIRSESWQLAIYLLIYLFFVGVQAPCEAEASCAALVKSGKVFATATEDMDGLTFGTNVLLRHLTASEAK